MISNEPKSHVRMLDVDVNKELNIPDIYEKIIRTGTVGEGSCFFHSVLKGLNLDGYSKMNEKDKLKYMKELRNKLSDSMTINQYKNNLMNISSMRLSMKLNKFLNVLYNFVEDPALFLSEKCPKSANFLGEIVDDNIKVFKFINSVLSITDFEKVIDNPIITSSINIDMYIENFGKVLYSSFLKEIEEIGANVAQDKLDICKIQINKFTKNISNFIVNNQFEKYKEELKKTNEWASDVMFGLLADYLDIDIYFININSKTVIPYDHVSKGDRHSVVVGWINGVHFENIAINEGKFIKRVFEPNHPFILKIKEKINQEKKQLPSNVDQSKDSKEGKEDKQDKEVIKTIYSYDPYSDEKENPDEISLLIIKKSPYHPISVVPKYFKLSKPVVYYQDSDISIEPLGELPANTYIYYIIIDHLKHNRKHPSDNSRVFDSFKIYKDNNWNTDIMIEKGWKDYVDEENKKDVDKNPHTKDETDKILKKYYYVDGWGDSNDYVDFNKKLDLIPKEEKEKISIDSQSDIDKSQSESESDSEEDSRIKIIKDVPGLFYINNAISKKYSKELYKDINKGEWDPVSKSPNSRKVQQYGYKYDYKRRAVAEKGPPIPSYLYQLIKSLKSYIKKLKLKDLDFNQVIINKYEPGQGISKHTDAKDYGPIIGCYTIESGSTMKFNKDDKSSSLYVKPNSLYIMSGDSRYKWDHEMPSTKSDRVDGKRIPRDQRISITFRNVPVDEDSD